MLLTVKGQKLYINKNIEKKIQQLVQKLDFTSAEQIAELSLIIGLRVISTQYDKKTLESFR
ncbi:MAG: hypothetical protein CXT78_12805 [Thaumarchaeota archaeon]|jgi:hypothetical protein|nr:MAG: hypothetical protein CXT78_12805 [Nitrososphaerota archaeon]